MRHGKQVTSTRTTTKGSGRQWTSGHTYAAIICAALIILTLITTLGGK